MAILPTTGTAGATGATTTTGATTSPPANTTYSTAPKATQGWYITGAIVVSTMLANTRIAPFLLGILGVALIYQINLLLGPKTTLA